MADPFSIAGSAVGVVSLGITVCLGLFQYYSSCQDASSDVKALVTSLEGLICLLQMLQCTIDDQHFDSAVRADVGPFLAECRDAVENLNCKLEKVKIDSPSAAGFRRMKEKLGNAHKRINYPFRENT
jgi:hypothetical protein